MRKDKFISDEVLFEMFKRYEPPMLDEGFNCILDA